MFRCITELRGLVIDLESFTGINITRWRKLNQQSKCLFLISDHAKEQQIRDLYPGASIYYMEDYLRLFAPSLVSHTEVINHLNMKATEIAYISRDHEFQSHAMNFLGGTIWVTDTANYEEASAVADLVCKNIEEVEYLLSRHVYGFLGEATVFHGSTSSGMVLPVALETPHGKVPLYMIGRYFGSKHYMHELHPFSAAISLNKKRGKKYYGVFNDDFARLYISVVQLIQNQYISTESLLYRPDLVKMIGLTRYWHKSQKLAGSKTWTSGSCVSAIIHLKRASHQLKGGKTLKGCLLIMEICPGETS